ILAMSFGFTNVQALSKSDEVTISVKAHFDSENRNLVQTPIQGTYANRRTFSLANFPTAAGYDFAYWIVNGVIRPDLSFSSNFVLSGNMAVEAIFVASSQRVVLFRDANGRVLDFQYVNIGGNATNPLLNPEFTAPTKPGFIVASPEWDKPLTNIQTNTIVTIQYVVDPNLNQLSLTVVGGSGGGLFDFNEVVTVSASLEQGDNKFQYWTEGSKIVSYQSEYSFTMIASRTITAVYSTTPATVRPLITLTGPINIRASHLSFIGQISVPNGFSIVEFGLLTRNQAGLLTVQTQGVIKRQSTRLFGTTKEFLMSIPTADAVSVRAYLVVEDSEENLQIVYSDDHTLESSISRVLIYGGSTQITNVQTAQMLAMVFPLGGNQAVVWSVNNTNLATISSSGLLTPVAGQTGNITVTATSLADPTKSASRVVQIIASSTTITTVTNYAQFAAALNGTATYIVLANDIDATGQTFVPSRTNFSGVLDGQGYAVINLTISQTSSNGGLFKQAGGNAVIRDINFINPIINTNQANSGLLIGQINTTGAVTIENIHVSGLTTNLSASQFTHGGLIGHINAANHVTVRNVYVDYTFNAPSGGANIGGILGVGNSGTALSIAITNAYVDFKVNGTSTGQIYGAAIGQVQGSNTSNVHFSYLRIKNTGSTNVLSNAGLVYSQLNTAGNNHFISNIVAAPTSDLTRAFGQNNGSSQVNGTTSNANSLVTNEIKAVSQNASLPLVYRGNVWNYNSNTNTLSYPVELFGAVAIQQQINLQNNVNLYNNINLPQSINGVDISWTSSHPELISSTGVVERGNQTTSVTLSYSFTFGSLVRTGSYNFNVVEQYIPGSPKAIDITGSSSVVVNSTSQLTANVTPVSIEPLVTWSIKNNVAGIISVNQAGLVTGLGVGSATVVATLNEDNSVIDEFEITVTYNNYPTVLVSNYTELVAALNNTNNINITLTANITASGTFSQTKTNRFLGVFDGQGYKITDLSILSNNNNPGMFREIGGNAVFKNIVFESPRISTSHVNSGLLAGQITSSGVITISNIIVKDMITTVTSNQYTHGGLIGHVNTGGVVTTVNA
ncbi:MAG: Ig-like domain-containing protein, partial [Candidatus Izemoplasmatales bacterium]|nr:Ig-like domain-containing protein [Candidatus Izemoplasmatales bacterium]